MNRKATSSTQMRRTIPPPSKHVRFIFDEEWQPLVRLEEYHQSGLGITAARKLVEQQRAFHYKAEPNKSDPFWTPDGRLVYDWTQTLSRKGSARATELYLDFLRWAELKPDEFNQTKWGRLMLHWTHKRRRGQGIVYVGISLP